VKTGSHDPKVHKVSGKVVGFVGAKLFVARDLKIEALDLPQSDHLKQFIAKNEHRRGLSCARLGVTATDWRSLADSAANALDLTTAQTAYAKVHDLRRIELLTSMERRLPVAKPKKVSKRKKAEPEGADSEPKMNLNLTWSHRWRRRDAAPPRRRRCGRTSVHVSRESVAAVSRQCRSRAGLPEEVQALAPIFRAELQAYQGKYQDAARAFAKAGEPQKAIDLFAVLTQRLFLKFSELQLWEDGVGAMPRRRDAVVVVVREPTRRVRVVS
jgi:hypothetical protein